MKPTPEPRKTAMLPESLCRKLDMYGLAAVATGIGIAALSSPAQAEVVYTPVHQKIGWHGLTIDLNHDGIGDFRLQPQEFRSDSAGMIVYSHASNRVLATGGARNSVSNLAAGYLVGPNRTKFTRGGTFSSRKMPGKLLYICADSSGFISCFGPWYKNTPGSYVGFKFLINGEVHYGWARLKVVIVRPGEIRVYLTGYAYETIANKPILTGATHGPDDASVEPSATPASATRPPATLGMLSAGAAALPLWHPSLD
jgi:hypothetical protein